MYNMQSDQAYVASQLIDKGMATRIFGDGSLFVNNAVLVLPHSSKVAADLLIWIDLMLKLCRSWRPLKLSLEVLPSFVILERCAPLVNSSSTNDTFVCRTWKCGVVDDHAMKCQKVLARRRCQR